LQYSRHVSQRLDFSLNSRVKAPTKSRIRNTGEDLENPPWGPCFTLLWLRATCKPLREVDFRVCLGPCTLLRCNDPVARNIPGHLDNPRTGTMQNSHFYYRLFEGDKNNIQDQARTVRPQERTVRPLETRETQRCQVR
jgi:hypothetical protein